MRGLLYFLSVFLTSTTEARAPQTPRNSLTRKTSFASLLATFTYLILGIVAQSAHADSHACPENTGQTYAEAWDQCRNVLHPSDEASYFVVRGCHDYNVRTFNQAPNIQGAVVETVLNGDVLIDPQGGGNEFFCSPVSKVAAPQKGNGCPTCHSQVSDPINLGNGNVYRREEDFVTGRWLKFDRYYNSSPTAGQGPLGSHWTHTYSRNLTYTPGAIGGQGTVLLNRADGRVDTYVLQEGIWRGEIDVRDELTEQVDATGNPTGWQVSNVAERSREYYDPTGRLVAIDDGEGFTSVLTYSTSSTPLSVAPGAGYLLSVADPLNREIQFDYDSQGRITKVVAPDGQNYGYGYDASSNLTTVTLPGANTITYVYNEASNVGGATTPSLLTGIIDPNSVRYMSFSYDSSSRGINNQLADGQDSYNLSYTVDGITQVTDPYGVVRNHSYTIVAGVPHATSIDGMCVACGRDKAWDVSLFGEITRSTEFNGTSTLHDYDQDGMEVGTTTSDASGILRSLQADWDDNFHVPTDRRWYNGANAMVRREAYVYNTRGQALARCEIDPQAAPGFACSATGTPPAGVRRTAWTYCDSVSTSCPIVGLLLTADGPRTDVNDVTTYTYYTTSSASGCGTPGSACHQAGDLYTVQDALGHTTTYASYDGAGRVTRITDPNGTNTDITYDPRGRVLTRSYGGATTTYVYDPVGNLTQVTDPDNVVTHYTYDAAHRLTDVTDALGNHIHYTLDNVGNKTAETVYDASNTVKRSIGRTYNALGQLTALRDGLNNTVLNAGFTDSYDANGNLVHTADALGVQRQSSFDSLNRLITTLDNYNGTDPATQNTTTRYGYDAKDNLVQVTDPSNLVTTYALDGLDNQTALTSPDTGTATATFDAAGNQLTRTDARGIVATSTYDALNRIVSTTYADTSLNVVYHYDEANSTTGCPASQPLGRLTRVVEVAATTTYCYDGRGNVIRKMQTQGAVTDATAMAYTSGDRLQNLTYPSGTIVSYTRNANGQISAATLTPIGSTAASAVSSMSYLPFGPVLSYTLGNGQAVTRTYDANYAFTDVVSPALAIHVARDVVGNVVALGDTPGASPATETYSYDPIYRLTGITDGATVVQAFTYNATGDRLSKTGTGLATGIYSYAPGTHRLNAIGNGARALDANGNTTASVAAGQNFGFGYNGRNRMTVVQANGQTVGTYTYNAFGQRLTKTATTPTSTNERFFYDLRSHLLLEAGTANRDYIWIDDLPVAVVDNGSLDYTVSYIHTDGLNTPRAIANSMGTTTWSWTYTGNPFGEVLPTGMYVFNLRFPGQYFDSETAASYNLFRSYEASTGRYLQPDPMGLGGGLSAYLYVSGRPFDLIDPLGLCPCEGGAWREEIRDFGISVAFGGMFAVNKAIMHCITNDKIVVFVRQTSIAGGPMAGIGGAWSASSKTFGVFDSHDFEGWSTNQCFGSGSIISVSANCGPPGGGSLSLGVGVGGGFAWGSTYTHILKETCPNCDGDQR